MIGTLTIDEAKLLQVWLSDGWEGQISLSLHDAGGVQRHVFEGWHEDGPQRFSSELPRDIEFWHVDRPVLYRLAGVVGEHEVDQWVGFRWWHTAGNQCVQLNGRPIYLRGAIRGITGHDHPNLTGLSDADWHAKSITQAKEFGINLVRFHSTVPEESYLNAADRLGFAVHLEIGYEKQDGNIVIDEAHWRKVVRGLCRHPSVAIYCLGNEIRRCGTMQALQQLVEIARQLDPSALVMDNCGWGQPDRPTPDVYCQHVAYFFPFSEHHDMFDYPIGFELEGLCAEEGINGACGDPRRPLRPTMAHETCHYIAMRDLDNLREKWQTWRRDVKISVDDERASLPWWVDALKELYRDKGLLADEPSLRHASRMFQRLTQRHAIESIRRSPILCGFEMLQLSDCWRYENSNGLLDSFDDPVNWDPADFRRFNSDSVVTMDLRRRAFAGNEPIGVGIYLSHFAADTINSASLQVELRTDDMVLASTTPIAVGRCEVGVNRHLADVSLLPEQPVETPVVATLHAKLEGDSQTCENAWTLWLLPRRNPDRHDPRIVTSMTEATLDDISRGAHRLWLYRPADLFDDMVSRPGLDLQGRRDLFKGVIWDRGDNLGGVVRDHPALGLLPHEGILDWQFAELIHHGCKVNLDAFPVPVRPIVQGVGRPVRDRMQVMQFNHKKIQPATTFRNWGWLFEISIGAGRLLVCGFNLSQPTVIGDYLLDAMLAYQDQSNGIPSATISAKALAAHLHGLGSQPRPTEGPMTQYWLTDRDPVETVLFWDQLGIKLE